MRLLPLHRAVKSGTLLIGNLCFSCNLLVGPAQAQYNPDPPPIVRATDLTGLDRISLSMTGSTYELAVPDSALRYKNYLSGDGWQDSLRYRYSQTAIVSLGERSMRPLANGEIDKRGERLIDNGLNYTFVASDGTEINLQKNPNGHGWLDGLPDGAIAIASTLTTPEGEVLTFWYKIFLSQGGIFPENAALLQSVTSNRGYQIKMERDSSKSWWNYGPTRAFLINNSIEYCEPLADICTNLIQKWPSLELNTTANLEDYVKDPAGNVSKYTWVTAPCGRTPRYRRPGSMTDTQWLTFDGLNLVSATNNGVTLTYAQQPSGGLTSTDPLGNTLTNSITGNYMTGSSMIGSITDGNQHTDSYDYDQYDRMTKHTKPSGSSTTYMYDDRGNVIKTMIISSMGGAVNSLTYEAAYSPSCQNAKTCNKPIWSKDASGNRTDYSYYDFGAVRKETRPPAAAGEVRAQKRFWYEQRYGTMKDASGALVHAGSPIWMLVKVSECKAGAGADPTSGDMDASCDGGADEKQTLYGYGADLTADSLNVVSVTTKSGDNSVSSKISFTYDAFGNKLTEDGPLPGSGDTTHFYYDAMRRVIATVGPRPNGIDSSMPSGLPRAVRNTYNPAGRLIKVETGTVASPTDNPWSGMTVLETFDTGYDGMDRKISEQLTADSVVQTFTQFEYDLSGRLTCTAVRMNAATFGQQPDSCAQSPNAASTTWDRITKNSYDAVSQLTKIEDGVGTPLLRAVRTMTYTDNGKLKTLADAATNLTTYEYDGFDRPTKTRYPSKTGGGSSTTDYEELGNYDLNSNARNQRLRDGSMTTFEYDALNRKTKMTPAGYYGDVTVGYGYDNFNNPVAINDLTSNGALSVTRTYDALGRLRTEQGPYQNSDMQYDEAGRQIYLGYGDGWAARYRYYTTGELYAVIDNSTYPDPVARYFYDDRGRRTRLERSNGATTYYEYEGHSWLRQLRHDLAGTSSDLTVDMTFNRAGQIVGRTASNPAYSWTQAVNVNRSYQPNGLNQYTSITGVAGLDYDGRGNLQQAGSRTYGYTSRNQLVWTNDNGVSLAGYGYDAEGRLASTSYEHRGFGYAGTKLLVEKATDQAGNPVVRRYVYGEEEAPLIWYEGSGTIDRRFLHTDERGSVVGMSGAGATSLAINAYDEYGIPSNDNRGRFQYTGQTWLPGLDMYYYKARIYSATLGRFMQTDPIGYKDLMNLYAYVGDDPINKYDMTGRAGQWIYDKTTGVTTLRIPVYYHGLGATPEAIFNIEKRVESLSIPNANYKIDVVALSSPGGKGTNALDLSPGEDRKTYARAGEGINKLGGDVGHIDSAKNDYVSASAHDTLHFVGIQDRYVEGPTNADGSRGPSSPAPGYTNNNIMTSRQGTELNNSQFQEAQQNSSTQKCVVKLDVLSC